MEHACDDFVRNAAPKEADKTDATQFDDTLNADDKTDAAQFDDALPPDDERIASALAQTQRDNVLEAAKNAFGIDYLFPWQRLVIANILDAAQDMARKLPDSARDAVQNHTDATQNSTDVTQHADEDIASRGKQIVLLPTGAGKSLCFLVPALLLDGCTLIIYPLLALMADQKRRIESGSLESVTFRGNQTREEREENFAKIKNGAKIIIANPEVLQNEALLARLCECNIAHIAIDEAHCVSEWGDSFRPAYLTLGKIIKKIHAPVVTAFTATASPHVLARVSEVLFDGDARIVRSEADRSNIHYHVLNSCCKKQTALMLAHTEQRPMIVFCGTRLHAEDMARELNVCYGNETARFYHAGMEKSEKDEIEKWFFQKSDAVLCATCAYGMGVDKKDIRTIVHLDAPQTAEQYIQEAGRSGRDGQDAKAILLWSPEDSKTFSQFAEGSREYAMKQFAETRDCRRQVLLDALDAEQAVCSGCDLCDARNSENAHAKMRTTVQSKSTHVKICRATQRTNAAQWLMHAARHCMRTATKLLKRQNRAHMQRNAERAQTFRNIQTTSDEEAALKFIAAHRKMYSRIELAGKLLPLLNERAKKCCGKHTWEHSAIDELLRQLKIAGKIRVMQFPWKHKITVAKKAQASRTDSSRTMHQFTHTKSARLFARTVKQAQYRRLFQKLHHHSRKQG